MFEKELIIDGRGHLEGRLASIVAKELLSGQRVTVVRCEQILKSGSLKRNHIIRQDVMKKRINTNPRRGFMHWKAPSRIFWKCTRGMLPHKLSRGADALGKLKVFEGIPFPYDQKKRMVIPDALRTLRLKARRNYCSLGDLASITGWTKAGIVGELEAKRKVKSEVFYNAKQKKVEARQNAAKDKTVAAFNTELAKLGY
jgi:large subunit ribosomal protein L13Ae